MAKNIAPTYVLEARHSTDGTWVTGTSPIGVTLTAAANDVTGVSTSNLLCFTADSVEGGYLRGLRFKALGTNATTKARIFLNNGGANTNAANNAYFDDVPLVATTLSTTAQDGPTITKMMNLHMAPGERVFVGLSVAVAAGWEVTAIGGKY